VTLYGGQATAAETITVGAVVEKIGDALLSVPLLSMAVVDCEGGDVRYWIHGDDPDDVTGHPLRDGSGVTLVGRANIEGFRVIAQGEGGATLTVTVFEGGSVK
jgi:hypothetical protein